MKIQRKIIYLFLGLVFLAMDAFATQDNPHIISTDKNDSCLGCHHSLPEIKPGLNTKNKRVDFLKFQQDGIEMCTTCHTEEEGHIVGVIINFSVPADLPLGSDKSIVCLTCHYTHGDLQSDRPQASYCFMDSLLNPERLHKSFLIRRNNVNGELCLTCHNTEQSNNNDD